ncbi:MAG: hypothetical protein ACI8XO_002259 [Verrucomicrobiales bacterium]|jgi:hypothetical protein
MNISKLVKKAKSVLNSDQREQKQKSKLLKKIIKKLKRHELSLKEDLKAEQNGKKRAKIKKAIGLAHAHRKKGLKNLKELKKGT